MPLQKKSFDCFQISPRIIPSEHNMGGEEKSFRLIREIYFRKERDILLSYKLVVIIMFLYLLLTLIDSLYSLEIPVINIL